jgi:DNA-binding transcriptional LysR family regulator
MEMHQIRYFLAVARELNFTHAAEACNVSQPSLSQAIRKLEEELGGELFRRERTHTHLTDLGRKMVPLLTRCYESALAARETAKALSKGATVPLRLGLSQTVDLGLLVPAMSELAAGFPGLELKFFRGDAPRLLQLLKAGDCELSIAASLDGDWERLDSWSLFDESFHLVAPRNHRLAGRNRLNVADLADERVYARPYCENAADWAALLGAAGIAAGAADDVGSDQDVIKLVAAGLGIAFLPQSSTIASTLRAVPLDGVDLRRDVRLYAVAGRPRTPAAAALVTLLRAADWVRVKAVAAGAPA